MLLTTPVAWEGNVEQYAGRLHRDFIGKEEVVIYDYVDSHIRVLERMYQKRLRTYKKIGYEVYSKQKNINREANAIYDFESYKKVLEGDFRNSNDEIIISSPGINEKKVKWFIELISECQKTELKLLY